ncbi:MAG TPA: GTPase [Gemmataceae bacterium]|nr:GTPase [Gemmataceae bacterium]
MSRWRIGVLVFLFTAPPAVLMALGGYFLWHQHWGFKAWIPMAASLTLAYILAWYWHSRKQLLPDHDFSAPMHWTDRDRLAWRLVEARAKAAASLDSEKLVTFQFYVDSAQELALELARAYHPDASDPIGGLTIAEILAVTELAAHDLSELVDQYLPGGHLLTINHWRQTRQMADWYQTASTVYWLVSALFSPIETGIRYGATHLGMSRPWQQLQQNLLIWFYTAYLHRVGTYLIEVNSGRLRVGVQRYRELVRRERADGQASVPAEEASQAVSSVTITLMGQVKAGKSSLTNAILGEQRAYTDVLPATSELTRYELQRVGIPTKFILLDTVGYGHAGPKADQLQATKDAAQQSDLLLLVMHARNPARQGDLALLKGLQEWFASRPDLKVPPILGVLTHIDLLSPAVEWSPPYDWQHPKRTKEEQIQQALTTVRDQLNEYLAGCVPVCTLEGKVYGLEEWFLPTVVELLDEAHAVALLRCLRAEADAGKARKVFRQLLAAGTELVKLVRDHYRK